MLDLTGQSSRLLDRAHRGELHVHCSALLLQQHLYALALDSLQLVLDVPQLVLLPLDVGLDQSCPLFQLILQMLHGIHLRRELHHRLYVCL